MLFRNKCIVGLDIGSSSIKAVELESSSAGYKLTGFGYAALPSEAIVQGSFMNAPAISSAIRDACDAGGIKAKEVASSVSGHSVIVKRITLPIQSEDELEETIRWEAEQYIPFDINEVNIDHQVLKEDTLEGQMDVILVAAKKDLIDDYTSVIADAGLSLAVLDVDSFAVGNMYEYCYQPSDTTTTARFVHQRWMRANMTRQRRVEVGEAVEAGRRLEERGTDEPVEVDQKAHRVALAEFVEHDSLERQNLSVAGM